MEVNHTQNLTADTANIVHYPHDPAFTPRDIFAAAVKRGATQVLRPVMYDFSGIIPVLQDRGIANPGLDDCLNEFDTGLQAYAKRVGATVVEHSWVLADGTSNEVIKDARNHGSLAPFGMPDGVYLAARTDVVPGVNLKERLSEAARFHETVGRSPLTQALGIFGDEYNWRPWDADGTGQYTVDSEAPYELDLSDIVALPKTMHDIEPLTSIPDRSFAAQPYFEYFEHFESSEEEGFAV